MNSKGRFLISRASVRAPEDNTQRVPPRAASALAVQKEDISRCASPTPSWKRLLSFRKSKTQQHQDMFGERGRSIANRPITPASFVTDDTVSVTSEGSRTRDISPESLRRFLSDDAPCATPMPDDRPTLVIPEDIFEEENEEDDNFATSAVSEHNNNNCFVTSLSPPPSRLGHTRSASMSAVTTLSGMDVVPTATAEPKLATPAHSRSSSSLLLPKISVSGPPSRFSVSPALSSVASSSVSAQSAADIDRDSVFSPLVSNEPGTITFALAPADAGKEPFRILSPLFGRFQFPDVEAGQEGRQPIVDRWMAGIIRSQDHSAP